MERSHKLPVRIYYEDTDAGGIVYYANYLKFAERGRSEYLREAGYSHARILRELRAGFAVRRCTADYRAPAVLDDLLEVETRLESITGARIVMQQTIRRDETVLVAIDVTLAMIDGTGRPVRIPENVRAAMTAA